MAKPRSNAEHKIDHNVRLALTLACDQFLEDIPGFQWLTHQANYSDFPGSLLITCVFDTRKSQQITCGNGVAGNIQKVIQSKLLKVGVKLKAPQQQVIFDSDQACTDEHDGNWALRTASREKRSVTRQRPKTG